MRFNKRISRLILNNLSSKVYSWRMEIPPFTLGEGEISTFESHKLLRMPILKPVLILFILSISSIHIFGQGIILKGKITNSFTNVNIPLASITIQGTSLRTVSDSLGNYQLNIDKEGIYTIEIKRLGYKSKLVPELAISPIKSNVLDVVLDDDQTQLKEIKINAPVTSKTAESPLSLRVIGIAEIKRNPGGNRDISKALQSLPGVATGTGFRNDIIVRGGAPNENRFYLDGIEIPNINHFATQGSSGGPVGLLNVDFIREVDFYSGAFPANRGNALSSVLDFKQKDGRSDKQAGALTLGSTDLALTGEGPLSSRTTYIGSLRQSYLQFLFKLIGLSFLPTYNDFQFKIKTKFNQKNELTVIGLGAIDRFKLNTSANQTELQRYDLLTIPVNSQNNYTFGAVYKYFGKVGYTTLVLSRNYLENISSKYKDNDPSSTLFLKYSSQETENKFRVENTSEYKGLKLNTGINLETGESNTQNFNLQPNGNFNYQSSIGLVKYGFFGQVSKSIANDQLSVSGGIRADGNTFISGAKNPLKQLSPRVSISYDIGSGFSINANSGLYYQIPTYTLLSFRDSAGSLVNQAVSYISNWESVVGVDYINPANIKFSVEGFYKGYGNYPAIENLGDTISLANFGSDFGVVGNRKVVGSGNGRAYGVEFLIQQRVKKGLYGIATLTLVRSEFESKHQQYIPSAWDSKIFLSLTGGKIFKHGWELGSKFRLSGGSPNTPYDLAKSSLISNYTIRPEGIPNYNLLNTDRLGVFYQLDARVDKKFIWRKVSLDLFLDIQNITNNIYTQNPYLILDRDSNGDSQTLAGDPTRYKTKLLENTSGNVLPSLGIIIELTR